VTPVAAAGDGLAGDGLADDGLDSETRAVLPSKTVNTPAR
jgi:hypothetical protein